MSRVVGGKPKRPMLLDLADALGRVGERAGFAPRPISGRRLLEVARRRTGLHDLGEGPTEEGLGILAASLENEAGLPFVGRHVASETMLRSLTRRLQVVDIVGRTPEIRAQEIRRPLFIVAPPRTGTTLLYNLLAQDPAARPLLGWEAFDPLPPSGRRGREDRRIARHRWNIRAFGWLAPDLQRIHPVEADGPEECIPLLMRTFVSSAWIMLARVPTYEAWVRSRPHEDHLAAYHLHRDHLRLLQWQRRGGGAWLLKSPAHLLALPALLDAYPDAVVVRTHRDARKVLPSTCSLFRASRALLEGRVDARALGRDVLRTASDLYERMLRPLPPEAAGRVVDVRYADLVADPIAMVERVQTAAGRGVTPEMRARVEAWLRSHPRHKAGIHRYRLEDFGVTAGEVDALAAGYHQRFDIPREE